MCIGDFLKMLTKQYICVNFMSSCWFIRIHISVGEFLKYPWSLLRKCRMCVESGFCCNSEEGVCTLFPVVYIFFIVQDLNLVCTWLLLKVYLWYFMTYFLWIYKMICGIFTIRADVGTFIFIVAFWLWCESKE